MPTNSGPDADRTQVFAVSQRLTDLSRQVALVSLVIALAVPPDVTAVAGARSN
jgi:hypothetical protein